MSVGIVAVRIVDTDIGAHPLCHKIGLNKICQQDNPLVPVQFDGERHHELTGKAAVLCFLGILHGVPKNFPICPFSRCHIRQKNLPPDKSPLPSVVMLNAIVIIVHPGTALVLCFLLLSAFCVAFATKQYRKTRSKSRENCNLIRRKTEVKSKRTTQCSLALGLKNSLLIVDTGAIHVGVSAKNFCWYAQKCLYKIRRYRRFEPHADPGLP